LLEVAADAERPIPRAGEDDRAHVGRDGRPAEAREEILAHRGVHRVQDLGRVQQHGEQVAVPGPLEPERTEYRLGSLFQRGGARPLRLTAFALWPTVFDRWPHTPHRIVQLVGGEASRVRPSLGQRPVDDALRAELAHLDAPEAELSKDVDGVLAHAWGRPAGQ